MADDWTPTRQPRSVWIGFDPREAEAFAVARDTIERRRNVPIPVNGLVLQELRRRELYYRKTERRMGQLYDVISEHPMATEFAISRFLVPHLAREQFKYAGGMALFMDCDTMVRCDIAELFRACDGKKAVYVVQHDFQPEETTKMDGQVQSQYARKNWSSVMLFNVDHPANRRLTVELVNTVPGRDLHRFCWLEDDEIGELGPEWNYLVGHTKTNTEPKIVHFTDGIPTMEGFRHCEFAGEWFDALHQWAS